MCLNYKVMQTKSWDKEGIYPNYLLSKEPNAGLQGLVSADRGQHTRMSLTRSWARVSAPHPPRPTILPVWATLQSSTCARVCIQQEETLEGPILGPGHFRRAKGKGT